MSPMVLFEAAWLESLASQSGLAKVVEGFGRFCSPWKDAYFLGFGLGLGP